MGIVIKWPSGKPIYTAVTIDRQLQIELTEKLRCRARRQLASISRLTRSHQKTKVGGVQIDTNDIDDQWTGLAAYFTGIGNALKQRPILDLCRNGSVGIPECITTQQH